MNKYFSKIRALSISSVLVLSVLVSVNLQVAQAAGITKKPTPVVVAPVVAVVKVVSPSVGSTFYIGDTLQISLERRGDTTTQSPVLLRLIPDTQSVGHKPSHSVVSIATSFTGTDFSWKIPKMTPGAYVLEVKPSNTAQVIRVPIRITEKRGTPTISTVTLSKSVTQIPSKTYIPDGIDQISGVPLLAFGLKATASSSINSVTVRISYASSTVSNSGGVTTVSLLEKNSQKMIASRAVSINQDIAFTNFEWPLVANQNTEYLIAVDVASNVVSGTAVVASLVEVVPGSGASLSASSVKLPITGNPMLFKTPVTNGKAEYSATGDSTLRISGTSQTGSTTAIVATFPLKVKAVGGDIKIPKQEDFRGYFSRVGASASSSDTMIIPESINVTVLPSEPNVLGTADSDPVNSGILKSGKTYLVTVIFSKKGSDLVSGLYTSKLMVAETYQTFTNPQGVNVTGGINSPSTSTSNKAVKKQKASAVEAMVSFVKSVFGI
jgi:hypothetical protein